MQAPKKINHKITPGHEFQEYRWLEDHIYGSLNRPLFPVFEVEQLLDLKNREYSHPVTVLRDVEGGRWFTHKSLVYAASREDREKFVGFLIRTVVEMQRCHAARPRYRTVWIYEEPAVPWVDAYDVVDERILTVSFLKFARPHVESVQVELSTTISDIRKALGHWQLASGYRYYADPHDIMTTLESKC